MFRIGLGVGRPLPSFGDADAAAFLSAAGITGATETAAVNTLVTSLKGYGIWSKMKAVYPFVTDNTNLMGYTEDFSNAYWSKSGATVTANDTTAPNGTLTADKVVFGAANNYILGNYSAATGLGNCYHSIWIKGTAGETIFIDDGYIAIPNVTLTGDWQQIQFYSDRGIAQNQGIGIGTYNGATARTIWLWGAQVNIGSSPVTYQPIATTQQSYISSQFKYNLVNPVDSDAAFRLVFNGGWTHSANGATPNGTNGWADTNLNPSGNITGQNSHISFYSRTQSDGLYADLGYGGSMELLTQTGNILYADFPDTTRSQISNTNSTGLFIVSNTSTAGKKVFRNNSAIISSTFVNADFLINAYYKFTLSNYNNLALSRYSNRQNAFASIGYGLTDTEAANLYTAVQAFQTSLSRQV